MLAVVFACQRFHQYIYRKKVQIVSEHKPLESIMKKARQNTAPWFQRILLTLQKYEIELKYIAGKENILADTLSCESLKETEDTAEEELEGQVLMVYKNAEATIAKMKEIYGETTKDSCLMRSQDMLLKDGLQEEIRFQQLLNHFGHSKKSYQ